MDSVRQNKVNSLLQQEMAQIMLQENRALFPGSLITVTGVRVTSDLAVAKIYLSFFPLKDKQAVLDRLQAETSQLRGKLGRAVGKQLRIVPELHFYIDDSLDRTEEIEKLLKG